MHCSNSQL